MRLLDLKTLGNSTFRLMLLSQAASVVGEQMLGEAAPPWSGGTRLLRGRWPRRGGW